MARRQLGKKRMRPPGGKRNARRAEPARNTIFRIMLNVSGSGGRRQESRVTLGNGHCKVAKSDWEASGRGLGVVRRFPGRMPLMVSGLTRKLPMAAARRHVPCSRVASSWKTSKPRDERTKSESQRRAHWAQPKRKRQSGPCRLHRFSVREQQELTSDSRAKRWIHEQANGVGVVGERGRACGVGG